MSTESDPTYNNEAAVDDAAGADSSYAQGSGAGSGSATDNKWSKNGFGQGVTRQLTGKFSKDESEVVRKAVEDFCTVKQISVSRLCSECDHKAELKGAWMEIAKRLPHRSVQSVYRHGLRQLHPFKRGAWTEEECESLIDLVQRMGKKWAAIQQKLNRSADSCRDKYREMSDDYVRGRWKENETEILKRLIRDHLSADPTANIKELGRMVEREGIKIPWSIISKRMGKRSRLSCFKKWQKMTGLFSPSDQYKTSPKEGGEDGASQQQQQQAQQQQAVSSSSTGRAKINDGVPRIKHPPSTHAAPTAGAAAALAATVVNNPLGDTSAAATSSSSPDFDLYLLSELSSFGVSRTSDVSWEGIRLENAQARWHELLEEWQSQDGLDDSLLSLPLSEIAQLMLECKTSAQRAAETVEAVDLPNPESLHTREI